MFNSTLTADRLRQVANYNSDTGAFTWIIVPHNRFRVGDRAGYRRTVDGYWSIQVDKTPYLAHRLAWLYVKGTWPKNQLDHINGIRDDNRISNLREATQEENHQNVKTRAGRNHAERGTCYRKDVKKWAAAIGMDGGHVYLGLFDTQEQAHQAYVEAKLKYHTFCPIPHDQLLVTGSTASPVDSVDVNVPVTTGNVVLGYSTP